MWTDYDCCMTNCKRKKCQKCKRFWRKKGVKRKKSWPIPRKMSAFNADNLDMFWVIVHRQFTRIRAKLANASNVDPQHILQKNVNQNWKGQMLTGNWHIFCQIGSVTSFEAWWCGNFTRINQLWIFSKIFVKMPCQKRSKVT